MATDLDTDSNLEIASDREKPRAKWTSSRSNWHVRRALPEQAEAICDLVHDGMRLYAEQSGLNSDMAAQQLTAMSEDPETVLRDIMNETVLVGISDKQVVATLRLKKLPAFLADEIREAGQLEAEEQELSLDASPDTAVTQLPSYKPEDYFLLSRFSVHVDFRANGLGAAMMRSALRLAAIEGKKGIFLYSAAENRSLLNFYRAFGFEVQSVSGRRGYARALLFATTPDPDSEIS